MRAAPIPETDSAIMDEPGQDDGSVCSVFMGKTNNPRVHQTLAELHGVTVPEAARLCQKAIVAVAKDISMPEAREIKQRFAGLGVHVRVTRRKS